MNDQPGFSFKEFCTPGFVVALTFALLVGLACLTIPPHLVSGPFQKIYPSSLIPWLAHSVGNLQFKLSSALLFLLGVALGLFQPRRRFQLSCAAVLGVMLLHTINVANDLAADKSTHNLLPFEYIMLGIFVLPTMLGAAAGALVRRRLGHGDAAN